MTKKLLILALGSFSVLGLFLTPTVEAARDCAAEKTAAMAECDKGFRKCTDSEKTKVEADYQACLAEEVAAAAAAANPNAGLANNFGAQESPFIPAPPVKGQTEYDEKFKGCTIVNKAEPGYVKFYSCLDEKCEGESSGGTCERAAGNYASRQKSTSVEEYENATKAHFDEVVAYQNCQAAVKNGTGDKAAGLQACKTKHLAKIEQLGKDKDAAANKGSVGAYETGYNRLVGEADQRALADAVKKLQSQTGFFDLNNLSVGNEKYLEIGGADNNNRNILARIINVLARLFGTVAVLMFVIGAFFMIVSQGDENQLQKGKTIVLYTIIGLLLGFTAYMIVQFVINMLFQT